MVRSVVVAIVVTAIAVVPAWGQSVQPAGRTQRATPSRIDRIRSGIARQLTLRPSVRKAVAVERTQIKLGQVSAAAATVTTNREKIEPVGLRERLALWSSKRTVTRTAFRLADQRSKVGDTLGARDALAGLDKLQVSGRERAEKRAFNNAIYVAKRTAGKRTIFEINRNFHPEEAGNLDLGLENLTFAAELTKKKDAIRTNPKLVRTARTMVKGGLKMAAMQAKVGNPEGTWQLLDRTSTAAHQAGLKFSEPDARRILVKAFEVSASLQYKSGAHDDAAASLYQARAIQRSLKDKPSAASRSLQQKLMPRMIEYAKAQRAAEAEGTAVDEREPAVAPQQERAAGDEAKP